MFTKGVCTGEWGDKAELPIVIGTKRIIIVKLVTRQEGEQD